MNKWQRKCVVSTILLLFIGPLFGLLQPISSNPGVPDPLAQGTIHSSYEQINTKTELNALSGTTKTDDMIIDPTEDITGATFSNFVLNGGYSFTIQNSTSPSSVLEFSIRNSIFRTNLDDGFNMQGSPTISGTNLYIAGPLQSNSYPAQIGSPNLNFDNVTASAIYFHVTAGTFTCKNANTSSMILNGFPTPICNNSKISSLKLMDFTTAILDSDNITTVLWVVGPGLVYIFNSNIKFINESIAPTISCPTHYSVPYSFVFQPQVQLEINLSSSDNIRGPAYGPNYTLNVYKNGVFSETITNVTESYPFTIDTSSSYEIRVTCQDKQGNVSAETVITIIPQANLLWLILMIAIIAGAAVAAVLVFFMWKQRQWQKTALVEIPA